MVTQCPCPSQGYQRTMLSQHGIWKIWGKKWRKSVFASLDSSPDFLSMIFGIFGKFRIDIGVQKNFRISFSRWKNTQKSKNLGILEALLNLYKELKHSLYKFFEALLNLYKELKHSLYKTYKGNASIPYINSKVPQKLPRFRIFWEFFHLEKNIREFFWTPMSIRNFPRIPKIILRTPADQAKEACEKKLIFH